MKRLLLLLILLVLLSGPGMSQVVPVWEKGKEAQTEAVRGLLSRDPDLGRLPLELNARFLFPRQLPLSYRSAGKVNAWYGGNSNGASITVAYELGAFLLDYFRARRLSQPEALMRQTVTFILLHEAGHGLIHELDLPVVGREEDAADELATILAQELLGDRGTGIALTAAHWFRLMGSDTTGLSQLHFWDEHSLNKQRFYKILCLLHGANPGGTQDIVAPLVPYTRLLEARQRYPKKLERWSRLLASHRKPPGSQKLHTVLPDPARPRSLQFASDASPTQLQPVGDLMRVQSFQSLVQRLNGWFRLPKNLTVNYRRTDIDCNMFLPVTGQIVMSRNFFESAQARLRGPGALETMRALEQWSLLQEFSRALIEDADLPITGEPEDAAVELTTMLVVTRPELRSLALPMAGWYEALAADQKSVLQLKYWSTSAMDQQRYFDLLGYLYSADPAGYPQLAHKFPPKRLQKLAWEYQMKVRNWRRLLAPYGNPF